MCPLSVLYTDTRVYTSTIKFYFRISHKHKRYPYTVSGYKIAKT